MPIEAAGFFKAGKTGDVTTWPREAFDITGADRISQMIANTIGIARVTCCKGGTAALAKGMTTSGPSATSSAAYLRIKVRIANGPACVDANIAAVGPAQLLQSPQERRYAGLIYRIVRGHGQQHADAPHPLALLRARRERPS